MVREHRARRSHRPAVQPHGIQAAGQRRGLRLPAEALADAAGRSARILTEQIGFGDFVFRLPDGKTEVARASDLNALETLLQTVPAGEHRLPRRAQPLLALADGAHRVRAGAEAAPAQGLATSATLEDLRRDLIESIAEYRREQSQTLIGEFNPATFQPADAFFLRIGGGSLGGKARGLAFVRHICCTSKRIARRFPGVRIAVPPTLVLDHGRLRPLPRENELLDFAIHSTDDARDPATLPGAPFPIRCSTTCCAFLRRCTIRWRCVRRACSKTRSTSRSPACTRPSCWPTSILTSRCGWSSSWRRSSASTPPPSASTPRPTCGPRPIGLEEEKMAVVLQQVVGAAHGDRFYPDFSGVVRSRNFYPVEPHDRGRRIRRGGLGTGTRRGRAEASALTFCPRYPRHLVQFSSVEDILANSQTEFWALEAAQSCASRRSDGRSARSSVRTRTVAEADGTLAAARLHVLGRQPCRVRRTQPSGTAHRQLRAHPEARTLSRCRRFSIT